MSAPLYLLETLSVLYREGSLAKSAKRLQTTQPTISRQLQQLQTYFQYPLFQSVGRQKRLTPLGLKLAERVSRRILGLSEEVRDVLLEEDRIEDVVLLVGGRREILRRVFGGQSLPCRMELLPLSGTEVEDGVHRSHLDMAITQGQILTPNYFRKEIFVDRWFLAVPKKFLRSQTEFKNWPNCFQDFPYATYSRDWRFPLSVLESLGFKSFPKEDFVFSDWESIEKRVDSGLNWAVLPEGFVRPKGNYFTLELNSKFNQVFYLYVKNHLRKQAWVQNLIRSVAREE